MIIGKHIISTETLSSTNTKALAMLRSEEPEEGTVIEAGFQTGGRGQAGSKWESEKDKNLLFSVILYPQSVTAEEQFLLSMTSSLAICDLLDNHCNNVSIKWPNDILVGNDKIAGILIESSIIGNLMESCVAGIGLNLNQEKFGDYSPGAVSLRMITGKEYNRSGMLHDLLSRFDSRYKDLLYGDRSGIRQDYIRRLYRHMQWTRFSSGGNVFEGRITDVLVTGQILIEEKNGRKREFTFREFRYLF